MGVLQRISLAYLFASLAVLNIPRKGLWILAGVLLIGYVVGDDVCASSRFWCGSVDAGRQFWGFCRFGLIIPSSHLYKGDGFNFMGDPEGLF